MSGLSMHVSRGSSLFLAGVSRIGPSPVALVAFVTTLMLGVLPAAAAIVSWTDGSGDWSTATNWSSNPSLPGPADNVTINTASTITVTHSTGSDSINSLNCNNPLMLSGGALSIAGSCQISNALMINGATVNFNGAASAVTGAAVFSSGAIGGTGIVNFNNLTWTWGNLQNNGGLTIPSGGSLAISANSQGFYVSGGTAVLNNAGSTTMNGTWLYAMSVGEVNNQSGGVFDIQSNAGFTSTGLPGFINNAGLFKKSAGTGTSSVDSHWTFNNSGTVEVDSGTLSFGGAFNNTGTASVQSGTLNLAGGGTSTGAFNVAAGDTLNFSGGTHLLFGAAFSNSGTINFNGATLNFNGAASSVTGAAVFSSGAIGGTGVVNFNNLTWTGNGLAMNDSGTTVIAPSGTLTINGSGYNLLGRTLDNYGTACVTGAASLHTYGAGWGGSGAAVINNMAGATFDLQGTGGLSNYAFNGPTGVFNNNGILLRSTDSGTSTINSWWTLNNSGTIQVQNGTLQITGSFTNYGSVEVQAGTLQLSGNGSSSGSSYNVSPGAVLDFAGGTHSLAGVTFASSGTTRFSAGNVIVASPTTVPGVVILSRGAISGSGTVTFNNLTWTDIGGAMNDSGTTVIAPSGTLTINGSGYHLLGRTLDNYGTACVTGAASLHTYGAGWGGSGAAVINNMAGATFDLQGTGGLSNYAFNGPTGIFNNNGILLRSTDSGMATINSWWTVNNTGTIQVQSGTLEFDGAISQLSGGTLTGGTWVVGGSSALAITTGSNVTTNQGSVSLDGPGSTFTKINTLANNQGTIAITGGRNFTTVGGLANSGTIDVGNGSTLTVNGNLNQTAGNLSLDNGGTLTAGTVAIAGGTLTAGGPNATIVSSVLYSSPASSTFQGEINGNGNRLVLNNPAAILILSGSNNYTGTTLVNAGTLQLGAGAAIPAGGNVTVTSGATFDIQGFSNLQDWPIGTLTLLGGTFQVPTGSGDYYLNGLAMSGGTVNFTGSNKFWLHLTGTSPSISTSANTTTAVWTGAGRSRIENDGSSPLTINVAAGATASGIDLDAGIEISNGGSSPNFIKAGAGVMRLSNSNNSASFKVTAGKLRVDDPGLRPLGRTSLTLDGGTLLYGNIASSGSTSMPIVITSNGGSIENPQHADAWRSAFRQWRFDQGRRRDARPLGQRHLHRRHDRDCRYADPDQRQGDRRRDELDRRRSHVVHARPGGAVSDGEWRVGQLRCVAGHRARAGAGYTRAVSRGWTRCRGGSLAGKNEETEGEGLRRSNASTRFRDLPQSRTARGPRSTAPVPDTFNPPERLIGPPEAVIVPWQTTGSLTAVVHAFSVRAAPRIPR